jgi:predicted negative regulator of RcsB-dependent stress response
METQPSPDLLQALQHEADTTVHPLLQWILDHLKAIGAAMGLAVVAAAGWTAYDHYREITIQRQRDAIAQLAQAPATPETVEKLLFLAQHNPEVRLAALLEAVRKAESTHTTDIWAEIARHDTPIRPAARLAQAQVLLEAGRHTEAWTLLTEEAWPEGFRALALQAKAFAAEQLGKTAEAVAAYSELHKLVPSSAYLEAKITALNASQN